MNHIVGRCDLLLVTLDTLRFDVATRLWREGRTPELARRLPPGGWEERHTPGSFTYAAHAAFFAGFLPTPARSHLARSAPHSGEAPPLLARPGRDPRLFALRFEGSETTAADTCVLDGPDIVSGLAARGYHTACIGGVGFFNKQNALGRALPGLFSESHWSPALGVTDPDSTENQVQLALQLLQRLPPDQRLFLFLNVSALHQPNRFYLDGCEADCLASHAAALQYVDARLAPLFDALQQRGPTFCIVLSDHGTAYGEDGFTGHRLAHPVVWTVPYAHFMLERR